MNFYIYFYASVTILIGIQIQSLMCLENELEPKKIDNFDKINHLIELRNFIRKLSDMGPNDAYESGLLNDEIQNQQFEDNDSNTEESKRSAFLRFGRSPAFLRFGRNQAYLRFGKSFEGGKRNPAYLRFGRK